MRILVIEDEALLNLLLTAELEACGWVVETAADARTALRAATQAPFDLAIVDLGLPDMSGATLLQHLQEIAPRMQFIVCTGYSPGAPQRSALPHGVLVLMKPWSREELTTAAERIMAKLPKLEPEVRPRSTFP
jgi:two-component system, OmpR family, response regulator PhoP